MSTTVDRAAVPRTPGQEERRARILESAQLLLHERDDEQVQVREVAEHAGVALGTLYRYFPSKEVLYAHALLAWSDTFQQRVLSRNPGATNDAERLRALLRGAVRAYERSPNFFRLLTALEVTPDPAAQEVFARFRDRFTSVLRNALVDVREQDAATIAFIAGATLGTALRSWALHGRPIRTAYEQLDATVDLIFGEPRARAATAE